MATGIIQAKSGAKDKTVKAFVKERTGGHKGTHQVIRQKIKFGLGYNFDVEKVAAVEEDPSGYGETAIDSSSPGESSSRGQSSKGGPKPAENEQGNAIESGWEWDKEMNMNRYWNGGAWVSWDTEASRGKYGDGKNWQWKA